MSSLLVLALSCLVAVALAVKCPPPDWEGEQFGTVVSDGKPLSVARFKGQVMYSYTKQLEYYDTETTIHKNKVIRTKTYRDWKTGYEFEYNIDTDTCKVTRPLKGAMKRICAYSGEVDHARSFMIGHHHADLLVGSDPRVGLTKAMITVLKDTQTPVSMIARGSYNGHDQHISVQYANVRVGCTNLALFTLPKACVVPHHPKVHHPVPAVHHKKAHDPVAVHHDNKKVQQHVDAHQASKTAQAQLAAHHDNKKVQSQLEAHHDSKKAHTHADRKLLGPSGVHHGIGPHTHIGGRFPRHACGKGGCGKGCKGKGCGGHGGWGGGGWGHGGGCGKGGCGHVKGTLVTHHTKKTPITIKKGHHGGWGGGWGGGWCC